MNDRAFAQLLDHCLEELAQNGDVDAVLRRHPQSAERLRPLLNLALETQHYYVEVPEPPGNLIAGKKRFLEAAAELRTAKARSRRPLWTWPKWAPVLKFAGAILALLLIFMPVGTHLAWSVVNSLPSQPLYPVKLRIADVYFIRSEDPEMSVTWALSFAAEHVHEARTLVDRGYQIPEELILRVEELTYFALESTAWAAESMTPQLLFLVISHSNLQMSVLDPLAEEVTGENHDRLAQIYEVYEQKHTVAMYALDHLEDFRNAYQTGNSEEFVEATIAPETTAHPARSTSTPVRPFLPVEPTVRTIVPPESEDVLVPTLPDAVATPVSGEGDNERPVPPTSPTPPVQPPSGGEDEDPDDQGGRPEVPPGLENRPTLSPGQENRPANPPGQGDPPANPPGRGNPPESPPGQDKKPKKP